LRAAGFTPAVFSTAGVNPAARYHLDEAYMSSAPPAPKPGRPLIVLAVLVLAIAGVGGGAWLLLRPKSPVLEPAKPDLVAAATANTRGIGLMEQFEYSAAAQVFEEAVKLAPDWTPAKINLGIALLNTQTSDNLDRALKLFSEVLEKEPENPYAHFCSGIIQLNRNKLPEALKHFEAVTRIDPNDAQAWCFRGKCTPNADESKEAKECFEKALKLNPYLTSARYMLAQHALIESPELKQKLLEEFKELIRGNAHDVWDIKYTEMGRYGNVIGGSPAPSPGLGVLPMFESVKGLKVKLAEGTTWAADDKLDELRKAVRARFGGAIVLLDYNRDGRPDILLLGAVIRGGEVRDLLLRNDGNNTFTDVTAEVGLGAHPGSFGAAVGDFDNDGHPDLVLAGPAGLKLFRNVEGKKFEEKTATAGFDKEPGVYLTAAWVDLDQDGDLDLVAAKFAQTPELALQQLKGEKVETNGRIVVFANVGEAGELKIGRPYPPLSVAFKQITAPEALLVKGPVVGVVITDVDGDYDFDLIVLLDGQPPVTVLNDRMLRFHHGEGLIAAGANWNGGLVLDANGDDQPDLFIIDRLATPRFLVSKRDTPGESLATRFAPGTIDSPALLSAWWADLDLDGHTDIVGLSAARQPVYLQGDGNGKLTRKASPFGPEADAITDLLAVAPVDLDGDGNPDVLAWSASGGLRVFRSLGNGNHSLQLVLTGKRVVPSPDDQSKPYRTNADGVGCWVRVHAGLGRSAAEISTFTAGLGQSRLPIHFGLGKSDTADVIRFRWPDAVVQAELNKPAGLVTLEEISRKLVSCPVLFSWDGERFAYVTDMLGAGSMGEGAFDGSTRPPRPEESVKIEPGRLVPKNGKYVIKIAEPMDEVMYLDKLRLDVIDHPADVSVFPDERFATSDPQPSQERLYFRDSERIFATKVTDHKGRDVTAALRERDGKHVDDFALRSWYGYAEEHFVELDFNGGLKALPAGRKLFIVLAGWTDYPYPESIYAATQAGVPTIWPVLEQKQRDGSWKNLGEIGMPAGLTRVMTKDITGWIDPSGGPLRIRSNLQIYWDQVFLAPLAENAKKTVCEMAVSRASLEQRGFTQEYSPGGKLPIAYDYDRLEPVLVTKWKGKFTRTGDVTELLTDLDDRHVICGPGDEVTAEFDAASLPALPAGWKRSFVLRTWGYCKDSSPTTITAGEVGPLPHRGMTSYPYDPKKNPPPAAVLEYDRKWNTRPVGGK
jgi:tetratricopeptide (TPR) repeat protein